MERQYLSLMKRILEEGDTRHTRNAITKSIFVAHISVDLREGFPLMTTKRMFFRGIVEELLFFIRGQTNSKILEEKKINIWQGNSDRKFLDSMGFTKRPEGIIGPMYGYQFRHFNAPYDEKTGEPMGEGIDQLVEVIARIRRDKTSRRILLTSYNPAQADEGVLYPCHSLIIQFYVYDNFLDLFCYNRSSDVFLGLPFNIASTSLLLTLIAKICDLTPRYMHLSLGDVHIYEDHMEQCKLQMNREIFPLPRLILENVKNLEELEFADFKLIDYKCHPSISAPMIP